MKEKLDTPFTSIPEIVNSSRFIPLWEKLEIRRRVMRENELKQAEVTNSASILDISKQSEMSLTNNFTLSLIEKLEQAAKTFDYKTHLKKKRNKQEDYIETIGSPEQERKFLIKQKEEFFAEIKIEQKGKSSASSPLR